MNAILLFAADLVAAIYTKVRATDSSGPINSVVNRVKRVRQRSPKGKALVGDLKGHQSPISRRALDADKSVS